MSQRTPREKWLAHLRKTMVHGETATERTEAMRLYNAATSGMPDGTVTGDSVPPTSEGGTQSVQPIHPAPKRLSDFEEVAGSLPDTSTYRRAAKVLADESCDFVLWRQAMGEADRAATWGDWQRAYSINLHQKHLDAAIRTTAILNENGVIAEREWDRLFTFAKGGRYPQEILNRARVELNV